uniref:Uncharacterized protein n=1 Tax=Rhizophora mucronata TaxID=61149 RepID=A0A2P2NYL0_RHIMU
MVVFSHPSKEKVDLASVKVCKYPAPPPQEKRLQSKSWEMQKPIHHLRLCNPIFPAYFPF